MAVNSSPKIPKLTEETWISLTFFKVKMLSPNAILPSRASPLSGGYDLSSAAEVKVPARGKALVPTDLSINIPKDTYARIAPRSGLTWKHSIDVGDDGIYTNYRGSVGVILLNHSDLDFKVKHGDRIAQLIIEKIMTPDLVIELGATMAANDNLHEPSSKIPKLTGEASNSLTFLTVKKLFPNAILPFRASPLSAAYDLSSAAEVKVPARGKALIPTDLSIAIPEDTYARIAPRLGLAWKHSIKVGAGVIDADYRGPVGVILFNLSDVDFEVKPGDRIAQLIIQKIITPDVVEVDDLDSTVCGVDGFESTAGYDLSSAAEVKVPARGKALVPVDLNIAIPEDTYARIAPRSGLTWKHSIEVGAGVIHADYKGPVVVILFNHSDLDFEVKHGDHIAQLIIQKITTPDVVELDYLDSTVRGVGGFGSTGVSVRI